MLPCKVCEGAGKIEAVDGEAVTCRNPACGRGYVGPLFCSGCTGLGCVPCGDTGLESCRREIEAAAVPVSCDEGRPDCCAKHQRLY